MKKRNHKKSNATHRGRKGSGAKECKGTAVFNDEVDTHSALADADDEVSAAVDEPSIGAVSADSAAFDERSSWFGRTVSDFAA